MYCNLLLLFAAALVNGQSTDYYTESTTEIETSATAGSTTPGWQWPSSPTTNEWYETTTYAPPPDPINTDCTCTFSNIWIDVIFAIDASNAMTMNGIAGAVNYILGVLQPPFPIGQYLGQYTRVGFIFYAKDVVIQSNLTTYNNWNELFTDLDNPERFLQQTDETNLEEAIKTASELLGTDKGGRTNTRKVIAVMASAYRGGGPNDPNQAANTFKEGGNIIIAIEYVQASGIPIPELREICSPGFFISSRYQSLQSTDLLYLFCYANCYCSHNLQYYNQTERHVPTKGCFLQETAPTLQILAARKCRENTISSGILPKVLNDDDANFLNSLFANHVQQWLGLTRDYTGAPWKWGDGTLLSGYAPWSNTTNENTKSGNCAIQAVLTGFIPYWYVKNCTETYMYSCQFAPCSADNYCAEPIGVEVENKKP